MAARKKKNTGGVRAVETESRRLTTVQADAPLWAMRPDALDLDVKAEMAQGPIVRLYPPADALAAQVDEMIVALIELGAKAVRRMPAPRTHGTAGPEEVAAPAEQVTIRAAVGRMVERWADTDPKRRAALTKLVSETLDEEGL